MESLKQNIENVFNQNYGIIMDDTNISFISDLLESLFQSELEKQRDELSKTMYSDEEVYEIIESYQNNVENNPILIDCNEWFNQFKKK